MSTSERDAEHLRRLRQLVDGTRGGPASWKAADLLDFQRLYRHACSVVARLESTGESPRRAAVGRRLVGRAHALLHARQVADERGLGTRFVAFLFGRCPAAVREEWKLLALTAALVYGLAALSWVAVSRDLDLASSLLSPAFVETEVEQLEDTPAGEAFVGNFSFGLGESPQTAGWIMAHNMQIGVVFFASALIPPAYLYLLSTNGLMLGTYTAVAGHWGQAGAISSRLWCHGVLEIQALLLAGAAGLCLVRAWIRPGPLSRSLALEREGRRALELLVPVFPLLFCSGLIEGFVSPHAPFAVRMGVAAASGLALAGWVALGGRRIPDAEAGQ